MTNLRLNGGPHATITRKCTLYELWTPSSHSWTASGTVQLASKQN